MYSTSSAWTSIYWHSGKFNSVVSAGHARSIGNRVTMNQYTASSGGVRLTEMFLYVTYTMDRGILIEALPQCHETEPQLPTTRFFLSLQEAFHPHFQRFLAEHVLFCGQLAPLQRSDSSSIQLPETVIR